ncbi:hypothetical protein MHZ92_15145 [Sporosarcina sp. ACRSL]|uniref:hypothetical protein n=1 Tax=Sporosarcina sp. ACRSL TaxID=2918215 RepID=UPI001EF4ED70|nr:hypothetical protein [Sporosarcina sp. ACRSL]MCG7345472.1 hypothetical protein [Sporosarcina sp. ACRSL]
MKPGELIYFLLIGVIVLAVILVIWLVLRKRKKWAVVLSSVLVIGYAGYFFYYPTLQVNTHAERYEQVVNYLAENYPDKEFTISPKDYEEGYTVGTFQVNNIETPMIGVILRVDKEGQVTQTATWENRGYPKQQELWREIEFTYGGYTLDKEKVEIAKQDEWIDGELTAFALTIDDMPAIALFSYSNEGYGLLELQQGAREEFVFIEKRSYIFIYIDERYQGEILTFQLKNGEDYTVNADQNKGKLIVERNNFIYK